MKKIKRNMVKCKKCGSVIESTKRVGIVKCSCGSIFIEGGKHYLKRGGNKDDIIEMTEYEEI